MSHDQDIGKQGVCEGGAAYAQREEAPNADSDPDLAELIARLQSLSPEAREALLKLIRGAMPEG